MACAVGVAYLGRVQNQRAQPAFAARAHRLLAIVPGDFGVTLDLRGEMLLEIRERHGGGKKNPRLALGAVQFRRDDEFRFRQRLRFAKARAAAVRQQVSAAVAARPADAIRIGPAPDRSRSHSCGSGESAVPRATRSRCQCAELRAAWLRARASTVMPGGQVPHIAAQHAPRAAADPRRARRRGAQDVALAQDGREVAGEARRAVLARLDQHMREPRMRPKLRQVFCHAL